MLTFWLIFAFVLGTAFGSFGSVLLSRLPHGETIGGRSHCSDCKHTLAWYDLIPIVSYVLHGGRCRYCHAPISARYPLLELVTGTIFALIVLTKSTAALPLLVLIGCICFCLILIGFADAASQLIPNVLLNILFVLAVVEQSFEASLLDPNALSDGARGAGIALVFFGAQWVVSWGKWIGSGDVLLGICIGIVLGAQGMLLTLLGAYSIGAIVALWLIVTRKTTMGVHIAFGPFLCIAAIAILLLGDAFTIDFWPL